jgi:hypothetical protein
MSTATERSWAISSVENQKRRQQDQRGNTIVAERRDAMYAK